MPRSGTTLMEQVITAHNDVASAGELDLIRELSLAVSTNQIEPNEESLLFIRERYLDL